MERKIYLNMCVLAFLTILLSSIVSLWTFYDSFNDQMEKGLRTEGEIAAKSLNASSQKKKLLNSMDLGKTGSRITLVDPKGRVLFDSDADAGDMENHADRPEILQAMKTGTGEAVRMSETIGEKTYYYAIRLQDNSVVRLGATTNSIYAVFIRILPYLLIMISMVFIICALLAYRLTQKIVQPIYSINLEDPQDDLGYDELAPLLLRINEQNSLINTQIETLASERDTINTIINNMTEGFVLLDRNNKILAVNKSATRLLGVTSRGYQGENFFVLSRNIDLGNSVETALKGEHNDGIVSIEDRQYHYFASPVYENDKINGAILLLLDVTEEHRAQKMRQEFSANVSHELKTPLTSISGYAEIIASGMAKEEDVKAFAGKIKNEAFQLLSLINDIIRLSELEENTSERNFHPVDLLSAANSTAERLKHKARKYQVEVTVDGKDAEIIGEENMIQELIYNLVENSIKYNKPGGKVHVSVSQADGSVSLTVADTGIGIPKEHMARIFERFYRADKSHSKTIGGTGLGLAIVKHIAQYHNAEINIASRENEGTKITVVFPSPEITGKAPSASGEGPILKP